MKRREGKGSEREGEDEEGREVREREGPAPSQNILA